MTHHADGSGASPRGPTSRFPASGFSASGLLWVAALAVVGATGCVQKPFPRDLFLVKAENVGAPVMVSNVHAKAAGRPIAASSGTREESSSQTYYGYNSQVTVTTTTKAQSEMPAHEKLLVRFRRRDRWLQLTEMRWVAEDLASWGYSSNRRELHINARAHE